MNKRLWLRNGALLSIPLALGLVLLRIKLVRDRANVPLQNIVLPQKYRDPDAIQGLAFSPDSQSLAIAELGGFLQIWSIGISKFESKFKYPYVNDALIWRKDNYLIAGGNFSFYSVALNSKTLKPETSTDWKQHTFPRHSARYGQCAISPTGTLAAVGEVYGAVSVWDIETDKKLGSFKSLKSVTCGMAFSADGDTLAVANLLFKIDPNPKAAKKSYPERIGKEIALHNAQTGALQKVLRWDNAELTPLSDDYAGNIGELSVAFSPDGKLIAGFSQSGLSVWNVNKGQLVYTRKNENRPRGGGDKQIAFSPDGSLIAAAGSGKEICVWVAKTGKLLQEFNGVVVNQALKFSPNGQWLASGGQNYGGQAVIKVWDVANMK